MLPSSILFVLACFSARLALAQGPDSSQPDGFEGGDLPAGEWFGVTPYVCSNGCYTPANVYYFCFLNTTLWDGRQADQNECNDYLCRQENYDQLAACLNCIVANGNERSVTLSASNDPLRSGPDPVGGYINLEKANGWLANVTSKCQAAGSAIGQGSTTTITASPTTTGPYYTSWSSGQTRQFPTWTGLTEYADQFFPSATPVFGPAPTDSSGSAESASSGTSPTSSAASSAASASSQATSAPNSGSIQTAPTVLLWIVPMLGLVGLM